MTELDSFEALCPAVKPLTGRQRAAMRMELFGGPLSSVPDTADNAEVGDGRRRPRGLANRRLLTLAALALCFAAAGATWLSMSSRSSPSSTGNEPAPTAVPIADETAAPPDSQASLPVTPPASTVPTALSEALRPDGVVLVLNASGRPDLGLSLATALEDSGFTVIAPAGGTGQIESQSAMYVDNDPALPMMNSIGTAVAISYGESPVPASIPGVGAATDALPEADMIVVLGTDLADAPWESTPAPLVPTPTGVLLVLDAASTPSGYNRAETVAADLRADGVEVLDVVTATRPVDGDMFMPIGDSNAWSSAVRDLAEIGGFDTWTPNLFDGPLPEKVTAVLLVGDPVSPT